MLYPKCFCFFFPFPFLTIDKKIDYGITRRESNSFLFPSTVGKSYIDAKMGAV